MKMQRSTHFFRDASSRAIHKRRPMSAPLIGLAVMVCGIAAPLCMAVSPAHAAATSLYLSPSSANVTVNTTFNVGVRINAGESINAVEANLTYNQSQLQYVSMSDAGSAFSINASSNGGGGSVAINRGQVGGVTGDKLIVTLTFKALASNVTSGVSFAGSSQALRNSDSSNVLSNTSGGSYALTAVAAAKPPAKSPTPASPPSNGSAPAPAPATPTPVSPGAEASVTPPAVNTPTPVPSANAIDDSKSASKAAIYGLSGLAVLVVIVAVAVLLLKRHHSPAMLPGAYVGDNHATIFGPSQPTHPVTPVTPSAPTSSIVTPTNNVPASAGPTEPGVSANTDNASAGPIDAGTGGTPSVPATPVQPMPVASPPAEQDGVINPSDKPTGNAPGT